MCSTERTFNWRRLFYKASIFLFLVGFFSKVLTFLISYLASSSAFPFFLPTGGLVRLACSSDDQLLFSVAQISCGVHQFHHFRMGHVSLLPQTQSKWVTLGLTCYLLFYFSMTMYFYDLSKLFNINLNYSVLNQHQNSWLEII